MFSLETDGSRFVYSFGHDEIGHVLFLVCMASMSKTRAGAVVHHRRRCRRHCPHWPARFEDKRQHLVWQEDPSDVGVFFCAPFCAPLISREERAF